LRYLLRAVNWDRVVALGSSVKTEIEERVGLFLGIRAPG